MQQGQVVKVFQLPKRPKRGALQGVSRPISLVSNHFPVDVIDGNKAIFVYSLEFEPVFPQDNRQIKDDIMRSARASIEQAGLKKYAIRGWNLWADQKLPERIFVKGKDAAGKEYQVKIENVREDNFRDLATENPNEKQISPVKQAINAAIKKALKELGLVEMGRNAKFYDQRQLNNNRIPEHNLKVWRGVKTSLCIYQGKPFIQIDTASRVLREETALQMMEDLGLNKGRNVKDIQNEMIGLSVLAAYGNFRIYRIDDLEFKKNPQTKFALNDGKEVTFVKYYKDKYNITIKNEKQPLIVYRDKRNPDKITYLIPELLNMTGLTDKLRSNFRVMKDLAEYTKLEPDQRFNEIKGYQDKLEKVLKQYNLKLATGPGSSGVNGQLLVGPTLKLGSKSINTDQNAFFILRDNVFKSSHIKDWFLIYQGRGKQDDGDADFLVDELRQTADKIGIKMEKPYFIVMKDGNPNAWVDTLRDEIGKGGAPQMIVSFIQERDKERLYSALKKFCFQEKGISHQNILTKFLKNKNTKAVASKIAQQMSVKLGFPLWATPRPKGVSEKTMVVGIDIFHKLIQGKNSCLGFVAHLDGDCQTIFAKNIIMRPGQELCQEIGSAMTQAIMAYYVQNGKKYLPDTIVVYRDGVGSGQIQTLVDSEISSIKKAIAAIGEQYNPKFAAIMINKKITDRFFAENKNLPQGVQAGKQGTSLINPPSGTIVSEKVVSSNFDFFLAAQYVTQGTCTPTHYTVLENNTDWTEEVFWQLTYFQCFNYQNWSGAVRVPACVQYAHKLSYLVGETFQGPIHKILEKLPCFL
ncbi:hypothetical protein pb186bvf_016484 [Paramecium bursaria]